MVTVGIINYNNARFLERAIESAKSQGADVVVVDDCSTDDSVAIAKSCGVPVIRHPENSGSAIAGWNDTIEWACDSASDWCVFLSSDDMLAPGAIEAIEQADCDWLYGDLLLVDEDDSPIDEWVYAGWPTDPLTALSRGIKTLSIPVTMFAAFRYSWLYENDCVAREFDGLQLAGDTSTCIEWLRKWPRIQRVPRNLFWYRQHAGQETHTLNANRERLHAAIIALYERLFDRKTLEVIKGVYQ